MAVVNEEEEEKLLSVAHRALDIETKQEEEEEKEEKRKNEIKYLYSLQISHTLSLSLLSASSQAQPIKSQAHHLMHLLIKIGNNEFGRGGCHRFSKMAV